MGIFLAPVAAFAEERSKLRKWLVVVMLLSAALPGVGFVATVDAKAQLEKEMRATGKMEQMSDEQIDVAMKVGPLAIKVVAVAGAVFSRALWIFFLALIAWVLTKGTESSVRYLVFVTTIALACVPVAVLDVLGAATYFLKPPGTFDIANPVQSNPAAWLGYDVQASVIGAVLSHLDLFRLWTLFLTGLGLALAAPKKRKLMWIVPIAFYALSWVMTISNAVTKSALAG